MKPQEVLDFYKNKYQFKKRTGMAAATLGNWLKNGYIPIKAQLKIEEMTNGQLKAAWHR